jgi:hypothetical protein
MIYKKIFYTGASESQEGTQRTKEKTKKYCDKINQKRVRGWAMGLLR